MSELVDEFREEIEIQKKKYKDLIYDETAISILLKKANRDDIEKYSKLLSFLLQENEYLKSKQYIEGIVSDSNNIICKYMESKEFADKLRR